MKLSERIQSGEWKFNQPSLVKEVTQLEEENAVLRNTVSLLKNENERLAKAIEENNDSLPLDDRGESASHTARGPAQG